MDRRLRYLLLALAFGMNPLGLAPAHAALGGGLASVMTDAAALRGTVTDTPLQRYDIEDIATGNGVRVREFVDRSGTVFAVSWSGPVVPDLQQLLGAHFVEYERALAAVKQRGLQRSLRIASMALVVQADGHLRAYSGRAYLPGSIPAGTSTAELR